MYPSSAQTSPDFPQTFPRLPRLNIGILAFVQGPGPNSHEALSDSSVIAENIDHFLW